MTMRQKMTEENHYDYFPVRFRAVEGTPRRQRLRVLTCSTPTCRREAEISDNGREELPPDVVRKKFRQTGWEIGKNRSGDICPVCAENDRIARRKSKEEVVKRIDPDKNIPLTERAVMAGATGLPPKPPSANVVPITANMNDDAPQQMDTEDRRIVFAAIDERWAGKDAGYTAPWTDQAIASHLGVPLGWVAEVRSHFFGEVRDNQEIRDLLDRVGKATVEASQRVAEALQLQKDTSAMIVRVNAMNTTLTELKRSIEGLIAIAERIERSTK